MPLKFKWEKKRTSFSQRGRSVELCHFFGPYRFYAPCRSCALFRWREILKRLATQQSRRPAEPLTNAARLVLVTREGCHLCEQALAELRALGHEPQLVDVDADDRLHDLYDWRVPVVLVDGRVVAEGRVTKDQLLSSVGRGPSPP